MSRPDLKADYVKLCEMIEAARSAVAPIMAERQHHSCETSPLGGSVFWAFLTEAYACLRKAEDTLLSKRTLMMGACLLQDKHQRRER